jgi:hypothetical protein
MAKPPDAALAHDKASEARGVVSDKMRVVTGCRTFGNQKVKLCDDDHIESTRIGSNGPRDGGVRHAPITVYSRCRHPAHCRRR